MVDSCISDSRYMYMHESRWPSEAVDVHQVFVKASGARGFLVYFLALVILANAFHLFWLGGSVIILLWCPFRCIPCKVTLEECYKSGKITRYFVPVDKILKPVLIECVTPVNCYWSLSFIVHGEAELLLVFKELRPPMKILVPIWKALCFATGCKESLDTSRKDG